MKTVHYVLSLGTVSLLVGCAAPPVSLGPVGPNPVGSKTQALAGELQVFSRVAEKFDDQERGCKFTHNFSRFRVQMSAKEV
jgi:hypothetical protein